MTNFKTILNIAGALTVNLTFASYAFAAKYSAKMVEDNTMKAEFYEILRGGFGSFIMIFCAFGGIAALFLTRGGDGQRSTPMMGVMMLLLAAGLFSMRVALSAGVMGSEYLDFSR